MSWDSFRLANLEVKLGKLQNKSIMEQTINQHIVQGCGLLIQIYPCNGDLYIQIE